MTPRDPSRSAADCPCGSGRPYDACCGFYLDAGVVADTAEALMRSRYSAYVLQREDYLLATWHPSTRPTALELAQAPVLQWLGLEVRRVHAGGVPDREGVVEFVARYKVRGKAERLHETSRFVREGHGWLYVGADESDTTSIAKS